MSIAGVDGDCHTGGVVGGTPEGWCTDPYQRHEARWMSQGKPSELVRDGTAEGRDPVLAEPFKVEPTPITASGSSYGGDLARTDDAQLSDPYRTWHPRARRLATLCLVVGLALCAAGAYLFIHLDNVYVSHFTASAQLKNAPHNGSKLVTSSSFPACPGGGNSAAIPVEQVDISSPNGANFTIYAGNQISIESGSEYTPTDLFCIVTQSSIDVGGIQIPDNPGYDTLDAVKPGTDVIFMNDLNNHVDLFKVTVLSSHTYETWARWLLLAFGLPLALRGIRLLRRNRPSTSLPYENPSYEPTWR